LPTPELEVSRANCLRRAIHLPLFAPQLETSAKRPRMHHCPPDNSTKAGPTLQPCMSLSRSGIDWRGVYPWPSAPHHLADLRARATLSLCRQCDYEEHQGPGADQGNPEASDTRLLHPI